MYCCVDVLVLCLVFAARLLCLDFALFWLLLRFGLLFGGFAGLVFIVEMVWFAGLLVLIVLF